MIDLARVKGNTTLNIRIIRRFRRLDGYDGELGLNLQDGWMQVNTIAPLRH